MLRDRTTAIGNAVIFASSSVAEEYRANNLHTALFFFLHPFVKSWCL
jgi:hypothetical protein